MTEAAAARLGSLNNLHAHDAEIEKLRDGLALYRRLADEAEPTINRLIEERDTARAALAAIHANCLVWQSGETEMSAADFLALVEIHVTEALPEPDLPEPVPPWDDEELRPTTTCWTCGQDFLDRDMTRRPEGEGETCPACTPSDPEPVCLNDACANCEVPITPGELFCPACEAREAKP